MEGVERHRVGRVGSPADAELGQGHVDLAGALPEHETVALPDVPHVASEAGGGCGGPPDGVHPCQEALGGRLREGALGNVAARATARSPASRLAGLARVIQSTLAR